MDHLDYEAKYVVSATFYQLYRHFFDDANTERRYRGCFRLSNLQRIKSGAFKARKAIPAMGASHGRTGHPTVAGAAMGCTDVD
jgi:hypothetical protein